MNIEVYARHVKSVGFTAGDVIFRKGDDGDVMYVVADGEVELGVSDGLILKAAMGETFGEMSIIDKVPRSATALALTDVELFPINRALFLVLVHETPYFALEVMKTLCERLRRTNPVDAP